MTKKNSATSSFRTPDSYFETKDWGLFNRAASTACVSLERLRHALSCRTIFRYSEAPKDVLIMLVSDYPISGYTTNQPSAMAFRIRYASLSFFSSSELKTSVARKNSIGRLLLPALRSLKRSSMPMSSTWARRISVASLGRLTPRSRLEIVSTERSIASANCSCVSRRSRRCARIRSPISRFFSTHDLYQALRC